MYKVVLVVLVLGLYALSVNAQSKVNIQAFEMSKCPYCSAWKQNFNDQVMSQPGLPDIINMVEFFAGVSDYGDGNFSCFHGPGECVGDKILLCAKNLTGDSSVWGWWNLGVCMQTNYTGIPDNAAACASKVGLDWDPINECANGVLGNSLLTSSSGVSVKYHIMETPTIFVNGNEYVGGPSNPLKLICSEYTGPKPAGCPSS